MNVTRHSHLRRFLAGVLALYSALAWPGSASAETFSNTASIVINDNADGGAPEPAGLYPSPIVVSGLTGTITKVTVTLNNLSHAGPQDMDIVLVAPGGQSVLLISDQGGATAVNNLNITLDDDATLDLPDNTGPLTTGTFKPRDFDDADPAGGDTFPSPGPTGPFGATLGTLNGTNPNGTWNLFVVDDAAGGAGSVAGGWTLNITTTGGGAPTGKLVVTGTGPGGGPHVKIFVIPTTGAAVQLGDGFFPYDPGFRGGVNVTLADVVGDSEPEIITGTGAGGGPHVRIFSLDRTTGAVTPIGGGFFAYDAGFLGGVRVSASDVDGDGKKEILTIPGSNGGTHVRVFKVNPDGSVIAIGPEFFAYDPGFIGGGNLAGE